MTSSAFSINTLVPTAAFHLVRGTPKTYTILSESKREYTLNICPDCGSALWIDGGLPGMKILKSGVLDGNDALEQEGVKPLSEQFTVRRASWVCLISGASQSDTQSSRKEVDKMLVQLGAGEVASLASGE